MWTDLPWSVLRVEEAKRSVAQFVLQEWQPGGCLSNHFKPGTTYIVLFFTSPLRLKLGAIFYATGPLGLASTLALFTFSLCHVIFCVCVFTLTEGCWSWGLPWSWERLCGLLAYFVPYWGGFSFGRSPYLVLGGGLYPQGSASAWSSSSQVMLVQRCPVGSLSPPFWRRTTEAIRCVFFSVTSLFGGGGTLRFLFRGLWKIKLVWFYHVHLL